MSTNYYHRSNECQTCDRYDERHIGKSAAGWEFSFRGYNDDEGNRIIGSWEEWRKRLSKGRIFDEYGEEIPLVEFVRRVMTSKGQRNHYDQVLISPRWGAAYLQDDWKDAEGWCFSLMDFS